MCNGSFSFSNLVFSVILRVTLWCIFTVPMWRFPFFPISSGHNSDNRPQIDKRDDKLRVIKKRAGDFFMTLFIVTDVGEAFRRQVVFSDFPFANHPSYILNLRRMKIICNLQQNASLWKLNSSVSCQFPGNRHLCLER